MTRFDQNVFSWHSLTLAASRDMAQPLRSLVDGQLNCQMGGFHAVSRHGNITECIHMPFTGTGPPHIVEVHACFVNTGRFHL